RGPSWRRTCLEPPRRVLELDARVQYVRAYPQVLAARVGLDPLACELRRERVRFWIPERDKRAMVLPFAVDRQEGLQEPFLGQAVFADALHANLERDFQPGERLKRRQHRRRGLDPRLPTPAHPPP